MGWMDGWMDGWMIEFVGSPSLGSGSGEFLERFNMEDEMCNFSYIQYTKHEEDAGMSIEYMAYESILMMFLV